MASVLIVDDEELSRIAVRKLLSRLFPSALVAGEAENGRVAVEMAMSLRPDIVLMDIRIPAMNGIDAARAILSALPSTRVIIVSAYDSFGFAQRAINIGVSGYLLKPVSETDFAAVFGNTLAGLEARPEKASEPPAPPPSGGKRAAIERAIASLPLRELGLARVAERLGMNSQHLSRLFKQLFGMRFVEYSTGLRIESAKAALADEEVTVEELCRRLGWTDSAHFTKIFKERTGLTPKAYARRIGGARRISADRRGF
ncbi:MAG: response regulator [Rectinemataceae bacterium]|jgi:YesN/AraC family two-component response regulator